MGVGGAAVAAAGSLWRFVRGRAVLCVSALFAAASMFAVSPDAAYLGYFDVKTLVCLFCILAVVQALRAAGAFEGAAHALVRRFSSPRAAVAAIVFSTVALSMVATNDMALVMMLPLAAATLVRAGWASLVPVTFTLQSLGANLGGMIVPFGNPQNLYLFSFYGMELMEFLCVMALPFFVSMALLAACVLLCRMHVPSARVREVPDDDAVRLLRAQTVVYLALLAAVVATVFGLIPPLFVLALVVVVLAVFDRDSLKRVDYALLLTFCCFFVFSGNMARVPFVNEALGAIMGSEGLLASAGLSQVISNVPAAVLLSHFTDAWQPLLVGVNIGGAGTVVGSLASLITLQHFVSMRKLSSVVNAGGLAMGRFLALFMGLNFAFLLVLLVVCVPLY